MKDILVTSVAHQQISVQLHIATSVVFTNARTVESVTVIPNQQNNMR